MDDSKAIETVRSVLALLDKYDREYEKCWNGQHPSPALQKAVAALEDQVRARVRIARQIAQATGDRDITGRIRERSGGMASHSWNQARDAIIDLLAELTQREEVASIVGPLGPRLDASSLHPTIWNSAAALWDGGHPRQAVQTAGQALEGMLQIKLGMNAGGAHLASMFGSNPPTADSPRLRHPTLEADSPMWNSFHDGAAGIARGSMMAIRNLMSHPGWPDPSESEALEMLAVMSFVARVIDLCEVVMVTA
jgi:hypothetical protein